MHHTLASFKTLEPTIDGTTFLAGGAAYCLVAGISPFSPLGAGAMVVSGINGLTASAISQFSNDLDDEFDKICATVAYVAMTSFALYFSAPLLAPISWVVFPIKMVFSIGLINLGTKIAIFASRYFINS